MHSIIPIYQVYFFRTTSLKSTLSALTANLQTKGSIVAFGPTAFYFNTILITGIPFITITHIFHRTINITLY